MQCVNKDLQVGYSTRLSSTQHIAVHFRRRYMGLRRETGQGGWEVVKRFLGLGRTERYMGLGVTERYMGLRCTETYMLLQRSERYMGLQCA